MEPSILASSISTKDSVHLVADVTAQPYKEQMLKASDHHSMIKSLKFTYPNKLWYDILNMWNKLPSYLKCTYIYVNSRYNGQEPIKSPI